MARPRAYTGGFLGPRAQARRIRRILTLAGAGPTLGPPQPDRAVLAWGHGPRAWRAEAMAASTKSPVWRCEDAFLRSIHPGRIGHEPPLGLILDRSGIYYDPSRPSDLETLLATEPFDDGDMMARAREAMERMTALRLSKYNAHDPALPLPEPGYVLVIDQVRGDASLTHGGLDGPLNTERLFREMLISAQADFPYAPVLIRAHPETTAGARAGHYGDTDTNARVQFIDGAYSPWALFQGAIAVYTVSSQMGFEAILAGHRPRVFGYPFYAGWGLTQDEDPHPRRRRKLTRAQLFAGAMMLYPLWYDPYNDALCRIDRVIDTLEARGRAWQQDAGGHRAYGMRAWKRGAMQRFFGQHRPARFVSDAAQATLAWAGSVDAAWQGTRVEDGLIRSRGLGAELTPPVSLVTDTQGIYYDPTRPSQFEALMHAPLPPGGLDRARRLRAQVLSAGITKYNLRGDDGEELRALAAIKRARPDAPVILVPGQVEDDASILLGAGDVRTNDTLLQTVRAENPDAIVVYKPHPDVVAGLRPGALRQPQVADLVLGLTDAQSALAVVDAVWTITSGMGFEALMRGTPVSTLGAPFYAGWGLTDDRGPVPERRLALRPRPDLDHLIHAALIEYPRYCDPVTGTPCPPEVAVERLSAGKTGRAPLRLRTLAKVQGWFAGYAWVWRR